jgi:hypothetical protein
MLHVIVDFKFYVSGHARYLDDYDTYDIITGLFVRYLWFSRALGPENQFLENLSNFIAFKLDDRRFCNCECLAICPYGLPDSNKQ